MKALIALLAMAIIAVPASAGTVTLAGACGSNLINSSANYTTFTLSNLGNQTATQLLVVPRLGGGTPTNASQSIASLAPGQNATMTFHFSSVSAPGSYAGSYSVAYTQGPDTFFTVFPCVLNFGKAAASLIRIYNISWSGSSLSMMVINLGQSPVYANVTVIVPQAFSISPKNTTLYLGGSSSSRVGFAVSHPSSSGATYEIAASASYVSSGVHYASLQLYTLAFPASSSTQSGLLSSQYAPYILIVAVIAVLVALIIYASIRKRRKGKAPDKK
ncbi:MAG: FeoB-associated Cys-rich membrane protein [Candidatus Marsarchaeota archaeon]|jgi:hypothetical protein|nr:FeoB-associated Cys-rich membrane protein [Candidatus Marsarchaeota archaeon]MCL5111765.1 FeoB-associated Cys-rich membrane protein [Candidatus Marsarchaeota archaeon]